MNHAVIYATDENFQTELTSASIPVVVDFWAEWCGPCKMFSPIFEEVATSYQGKVKAIKVNVDDCPNTAQANGIRGIPTIMIFKAGKAVATKVGSLSKAQFAAFIEEHIK